MSANQSLFDSPEMSAFGSVEIGADTIASRETMRTQASKRRAKRRREAAAALDPQPELAQTDYTLSISESGKEIYSCSHCPKKFGRIYNLRSHIKVWVSLLF
jgi:hypothetical protein